ncbi:MAG: PVC-type heme-binding CxxCH protein [Isosphaeraceae bacterium]
MSTSTIGPAPRAWLATWMVLTALAARGDDEATIMTPPGFDRPGAAATFSGPTAATLELRTIDAATGQPTPCRINVVGPDGRFYQPAENRLSLYSLTGEWPKVGKGNRQGKAPIRYLGRFFYSTGTIRVAVPAGRARVEVWKGLEFRPETVEVEARAGATKPVTVRLGRVVDMAALGYESGDPHLHFRRQSDEDDAIAFDFLEAEDVRYGALLGYNEPAGPYTGIREKLDYPQLRGLGAGSERRRGVSRIVSGQEYRSSTYGHLNLYLRDDLVREGESLNADHWPLYGMVGRETHAKGGFAIHAHGGYAQSIYADFVQGDVDAVELLQFGVYRGIGLDDWYHILNLGYRFPCVGASDYPACRKLADCVTYVRRAVVAGDASDSTGWFRGASAGRGFVTTGPLLLLEVDGQQPGDVIARSGAGPHRLQARIRVVSPVAPVRRLSLVVNGRTVKERTLKPDEARGAWLEEVVPLELTESSWIAARADSGPTAAASPDAEAHTNPVYFHLDGRAPYRRESLDQIVAKLDGQLARHRARTFAEKAKVLDYFQASRDILLRIREANGLPASGLPRAWRDAATQSTFDPSQRAHGDAALAEFLRPLPPKSPTQALATFESAAGFRLEPLAAEPLIHSPVAAAYDENGDLYVTEMIDYPYKPRPGQKPLGTVRLLRDTDGDGRFDVSHVFADGLLWAAGVAPWKGGVFVASPPDIWYLKDTDGDHVADVRRKVFTGFGTENEQGMLNNLVHGIDHRIYGSTSVNGGQVRRASAPESEGVSVKGLDFRFDPNSEVLEPITGTVQFGNTFDDYGNRFLCSESRPLMHAVLPRAALARNPNLAVATALENVAGNPVPIFRISPTERWRQIRSSRRIAHGERGADSAGASHHVVDAAAGVTIYRGDAYPPEYRGNAFVCDAQNNLIHRMKLVPSGPTFRAERADVGSEFVRSSDNWFRPVNLVNAPDGTLHVLDMSREVIEAIHIPTDVVKHLDLRRGRDQGRIYRIVPPGGAPHVAPRLGSARTSDLVQLLASSNGWTRDTAHRLLFERQDRSAIEPLEVLATRGAEPVSRILALWSLEGLEALSEAHLLAAMSDRSPRVVEQAVILAESRLERSRALRERCIALAGSDDSRVRLAVALALGATRDEHAAGALAELARRDASNVWMRTAVLASSSQVAGSLFVALASDRTFASKPEGAALLDVLARMVGTAHRAADVDRVLGSLASDRSQAGTRPLLLALIAGLRQAGVRLDAIQPLGEPATRLVADLLAKAEATTRSPSAAEKHVIESLAVLGGASLARSEPTLIEALGPSRSGSIQVAAIRALAGYPDDRIATALLEHVPQLSPAARADVVTTLLSRESWTLALLDAADRDSGLSIASIDPAYRSLLLQHRNPRIIEQARKIFGSSASAAGDPVARFAPALALTGDPKRGVGLFEKHCMACHRVGNRGHAVGPDLGTTQFQEPQALLTHILDPNRYVAPNYVQYIVSDQSGRIFTGMIASETASSLTLRRAEGAEDTILRTQIDELRGTGKSLMPEDFASRLTQQDAADLVAFLLQNRGAARADQRLEIGTLPGLVEPER